MCKILILSLIFLLAPVNCIPLVPGQDSPPPAGDIGTIPAADLTVTIFPPTPAAPNCTCPPLLPSAEAVTPASPTEAPPVAASVDVANMSPQMNPVPGQTSALSSNPDQAIGRRKRQAESEGTSTVVSAGVP